MTDRWCGPVARLCLYCVCVCVCWQRLEGPEVALCPGRMQRACSGLGLARRVTTRRTTDSERCVID
jgi:hypothetical protein